MKLCRTDWDRLRQGKPDHLLGLVIGHCSFLCCVARLDFSFSDIQVERIESDLLGRRAHTHIDRFFAREDLLGNDGIEGERVMTWNNVLRKALSK